MAQPWIQTSRSSSTRLSSSPRLTALGFPRSMAGERELGDGVPVLGGYVRRIGFKAVEQSDTDERKLLKPGKYTRGSGAAGAGRSDR